MPGEIRRRAKAINFGIIYGISAFGLANQLGIAREEAGAYIKKYFERFPGIRDYMEETKAFCKKNGYVLTLFGRKCHYPEIAASNPSIRAFNERASINARLQGTAADIIRRAMVRMDAALAKQKLNAQMLLQVHDELVFEVPEDEVEKTLPVIKKVMEEAPLPALSLSVPLQVDARAAAQLGRGTLNFGAGADSIADAHGTIRGNDHVAGPARGTKPGIAPYRHCRPGDRPVPRCSYAAGTALDGTSLRWPWALPFVGLLLTIATGPLLFPRIWHDHYGKLAFVWSALTVAPLAAIYGTPTAFAAFVHVMLAEYMSFIVLLFALYVVAGGILVTGNLRGTPLVNGAILTLGTAERERRRHDRRGDDPDPAAASAPSRHGCTTSTSFVFFIFLVANIGGALSPLGDPPLFVGFLHGVDFFWTTRNLLVETALVAGLVLAIFLLLDLWHLPQGPAGHDRRRDPAPDEPRASAAASTSC